MFFEWTVLPRAFDRTGRQNLRAHFTRLSSGRHIGQEREHFTGDARQVCQEEFKEAGWN